MSSNLISDTKSETVTITASLFFMLLLECYGCDGVGERGGYWMLVLSVGNLWGCSLHTHWLLLNVNSRLRAMALVSSMSCCRALSLEGCVSSASRKLYPIMPGQM